MFGRVFRGIPREVIAMALAARDPATPAIARILAVAAGLYAISPVDLVPDVLLGIGWLDDLLVVPTVMALAARFVPLDVMTRARLRADGIARQPRRWLMWGLFALVWLVVLLALAVWGLSAVWA